MKFKANVGLTDRIIRLTVGIIALYFAYMHPVASNYFALKIVLTIISLISVSVFLTSYCPLYSLVNLSTRKKSNWNKDQ